MSAEPSPAVRRRSPLHAEHAALGARFTEFGGWEMPLSYPAGTVAEHLSCRNHAAVFDVSHLGTVRVSGRDAFTVLQSVLTNDLARIAPGRAQYSHLLDPADASVVDDVIVWWVSEQRFDVMPNASNTDRLVDAVTSEVAAMRSSAIEIEEVTEQRAVVALQGPAASEILAALGASVERFAVSGATLAGVGCVIAGTGYTGERGAEIACRVDDAPGLWRALVAEGAAPAGLGARDTLRLEAGLPLHGHELGPGITPDDARLSWVVRTAKGPFRGCEALARARSSPGRRRLHGLLGDDRRPLRDGAIVLDANGSPIGTTSSGSFSPVLERGIALAFLDRDLGDGTRVGIELRGRIAPAVVTTPPFVRSPR